jgi:hypothetical protein
MEENSNNKGKERKIIDCDGLGCDSACCFGCKCCENRGKQIKAQEAKIIEQKKQILDLLSRTMSLGGININTSQAQQRYNKFLEEENVRLRKERNE